MSTASSSHLQESDKKLLLNLARESIASYYEGLSPDLSKTKHLREKQGVFVTLHEQGDLRGCIGFPHPVHPLNQAIVEAARSAAFGDPRFPPVLESELKRMTIEISVLTVPVLLKVKSSDDYLKKIKIGTHGLIIEGDMGSGLLLPQVATENKFTVAKFLECLCQKAALPKTAWNDLDNKIYLFEAEIFSEKQEF
jgi:hypothetical protein